MDWLHRNILVDSTTIGILAFVIVLTLIIYAATNTSFASECQATCQVHS